MKRDLYAKISARIIAEQEAGAAPWIKHWSATPGAILLPQQLRRYAWPAQFAVNGRP